MDYIGQLTPEEYSTLMGYVHGYRMATDQAILTDGQTGFAAYTMIQQRPAASVVGSIVSWTDEATAGRPAVRHTAEVVADHGPTVTVWQGPTAPVKYVTRNRLSFANN